MRAAGFWSESELQAWEARVVSVGRVEASSSEIRRAFAAGDLEAAEKRLPAEVAAYVAEHGLYRAAGQRTATR
jgi:nicotinic acid mononucleotide adenylyltransferase